MATWSPATSIWTGEMKNGDKVYKRGTITDQKAIDIELALDIISPCQSGNVAVIDYINKEDWIK